MQGYPGPTVYDADPVGAVKMWLTATPPAGFLLCDGTAYSRTTYSALFAVFGTTFGAGDGSTTFNVPDMRGRVPVGADPGGVNLPVNKPALAATGGEEQHTLLTAELASHTHAQETTTMRNTNVGASLNAAAGTSVALGGTTQSQGSGTAHNNLQPYLAINWIVKYASGFVGVTTQTPGNQSLQNYLVNGGMDLAQRQTPATYTTPTQVSGSVADNTHDGYSLDQWKCSFQTATLKAQRVDTNGALESGITAPYYGQWQQQTGAGKFMVYQPLEGRTTMALAGQTVTFQAKVKSSSAKTIRMAVIQLTSAGTIDTIPNPLVTSWNSNTVDPTLGTNLSVIASATSQSTTTAWANFSVTVTLPTNAKNIIVAFWTDSQFSINDTLAITEAGLYLSTQAVTPWQPPSRNETVTACQRFYWKSFPLDTAPVQNSGVGSFIAAICVAADAAFYVPFAFPVAMRGTPIYVTYSPSLANANWSANPSQPTASAVYVSQTGLLLRGVGNQSVGNGYTIHLSVDAGL